MSGECEHKFGLKSRGDELYCPVCRRVIPKKEIDNLSKTGEGWWKGVRSKSE